jgi:acetyl esterase/lipase
MTVKFSRFALCVQLALALCSNAQEVQKGKWTPEVVVAPDGTVTVPQQQVPVSAYLSPEAKAYVAQHLKDMQDPSATYAEKGIPRFMKPYLERQQVLYPVKVDDTNIAGVHVYIFTPNEGVGPRNSDRVLINLHGGGFSGCWPGCALLESIPIAASGGFKVVSIDYRQGPAYKFPAASEDVATVYAELLKKYQPRNVGIYGCSAGGALTGMSLAWFQTHNLPAPGAVGIFCAGTGSFGGGDAAYTAFPLGEARVISPKGTGLPPLGYMAGTDPNDPLVAQNGHPEVLAKFPPTLVITGTRDFAMTNAIQTNLLLAKAGVDTQLLVWEGLFHGFFYNPDVPESKDAYAEICRFFDKHLGPR